MRVSPAWTLAAVGLVASLLAPATAGAIPPFARKYGVTCATCHQPVPRLNTFGQNFAQNGFEFAIGEAARDTIGTGDPLLTLQRDIPLGVRVDAYQRYVSKHAAGEPAVDQQLPYTLKILSGGKVAEKVSYYFYFLASERGEVTGLEDAYIQFTDIGGSGISAIVGQFQVSDPLFKRELRLHFEDYQAYRVRVGDVRADLTYDRGMMLTWNAANGLGLVLQIVNGQGLTAADAARQYDRDGFQNVALRANQQFGPLRLGVFGYVGEEGANGVSSTIRMLGPDATYTLGTKGELNVQLMRRWDSDPFLGSCSVLTPCPGGHTEPFGTKVDAAMAEIILWPAGPMSRWYFTGLYNHAESADPVISLRLGEAAPVDRHQTASVGAHYLLRRNIRLMGEGQWDAELERFRLVSGFTIAF